MTAGDYAKHPNATASVTHLIWVGRWIEVTRVRVMGEEGWRFKCGRDAADWLVAP